MGQKSEISFLDGIYTDRNNEVRAKYPINLFPIVTNPNGVSEKYLRITDGISLFVDVNGADRGGINWNGVLYRVVGSSLISISKTGEIVNIADVGHDGNDVVFDYSFDYLAINSGKSLFLYDGNTCKKVTDSDLGDVYDMVYMNGYFVTTDGESIVTTDISNPFSVSPFNYGSSEKDPDKIISLVRLRDELYAVNRYTVEAFRNVGGTGFPFSVISGGNVATGAISRNCVCVFLDSICFIGSGRNESVGIHIMSGGAVTRISNRDIDLLLLELTEEKIIETVSIESRSFNGHDWLYVHFRDKTLVYDPNASKMLGKPIWYQLNSGITNSDKYLARNFVWVYDKWFCGHPDLNKIGFLTENITTHWGKKIRWQFDTQVIFNQGNNVILNSVEITTVSSSIAIGNNPTVSLQISHDTKIFSEHNFIELGKAGQTENRAIWRRCGYVNNVAILRFSGDSDDRISIMRVDADFDGGY